MQLDESTDVAAVTVLLAFLRYVAPICNSQVAEEVLKCKRITGEDIFNISYLYTAEKGLRWKRCVDICRG